MWSRSDRRSAGGAAGVVCIAVATVLGTSTAAQGAPEDPAVPQESTGAIPLMVPWAKAAHGHTGAGECGLAGR